MRILVVDDDPLTVEGLRTILSGLNYAVESATRGEVGWQLIESFQYDLILLDVMLPDLDGIGLCRRLRSKGFQMPVLLLTGRDSAHEKAIGLDAGADDYLVKPFDPEELVARIRALLRRSSTTVTPVLEWGQLQLDPSTCQATYSERPLTLTPKEYALLELFLRNNRRVFSCSAILDHLWSFEETPGEEAVRTHIKGLRQKLKTAGAPADLIDTVYGIGYRLKPVEDWAPPAKQPAQPVTPGEQVQQQTLTAIAGVWERFKGRVQEQITVLEKAAQGLIEGTVTQELQVLARQEAHTLAGSLGTFGFPEASQLARQIEKQLEKLPAISAKETQRLQEWVTQLRQKITQSPGSSGQTGGSTAPVDHDRPLLLVVDPDRLAADLLVQEAENWGIRATIVSDPKAARQAIAAQRPDVVLLDPAIAPIGAKAAIAQEENLAFLAELSRQTPPLPVLVFTAEGHQMERLEVVRRGGRAFLQKPAPPEQVLEAVLQIVKRSDSYTARILAVDDDPQILATLQTLLDPWGLKVISLTDPRQFWDTLESMPPDLLILDICMPHLNGIELCQIVRNDPRWSGLPILFLTAQTDPTLVNQVFAVGADDFIHKPIVGPELLARILARLERTHWLRRLTDTDPLTGVYNRHKSSRLLEESLHLAQQQQQTLCFAVLDLDHLRQINDRYGHATGDAVLNRLGSLLQHSFRGDDVVARWGGEEFVIGIYGMTKLDAQQRLLSLLQAFHQEEFTAPSMPNDDLQESIKFRATFTVGVAQYPDDGTDLRSLYRSADMALSQVKAKIKGNISTGSASKHSLNSHIAVF